MSVATKAAVATSLALLLASAAVGCSDAQAAQGRRYKMEPVGVEWGLSIHVVTDTETGDRWLVASMSSGGVSIEPMGEDE